MDLAGGSLQSLRLNSLEDLFRVDDALEVTVDHLGTGKDEALLLVRFAGEGSEDGVQSAESRLGPNNQTTQMSSRGELQQV